MSMHAKLNATMINRDTNAYKELLHEDCVFVFHKSGNEFGKTEWISMVEGMMANEKFVNNAPEAVLAKENAKLAEFTDAKTKLLEQKVKIESL